MSKGTTSYSIGICTAVNGSQANAAIIQQENGVSYVLGQLDQANLAGGGQWYCYF